MAWTTEIESLELVTDGIAMVVVFHDDAVGRKERRSVKIGSPTVGSIKATLRSVRDNLTVSDDVLKVVQPGLIDLTPDTPPDDPNPELTAFRDAMNRLSTAKRKVDLGIVSADAKEVTDLVAETVAAYRPEFLTL